MNSIQEQKTFLGEITLLLGQHACFVDINNQLELPENFREFFGESVFITQGFDQTLLVLTANAFQEIYECAMGLSMTNPLARQLLRLVLGNASELEVSDDGFIRIPGYLRDFAKISNEVTVVGQGDYIELWAPYLWRQQEANLNDTETNVERFSSLSISLR